VNNITWQYLPSLFEGDLEKINPLKDIGIMSDVEGSEDEELFAETFTLFPTENKDYIKGVLTQFGVLPVNEHFSPFEFWIGHTNFFVSTTILDIIEKTPGVETLDLNSLTPYRFKISIGRHWVLHNKRKEVLRAIEHNIYKYLESLKGSQDGMFEHSNPNG
jgi:hypothetical protein